MVIDQNIVAIIAQLVVVIAYVARLSQKVNDLDKAFSESKNAHKEIRDELNDLMKVVIRSDEKLVQLSRKRIYEDENGSGNNNGNYKPAPRKRRK